MDSERFASPIKGIFCGGLNAYCMHIRLLFLRTSGSSGVLKALLLERNGQLSCNPKKKKKKRCFMDVHHPSDSGCIVNFSFTACSGHHVKLSLRLLSLHSCKEYLSLPKKKREKEETP